MKHLLLYLLLMAALPFRGWVQQLQITTYSSREGVPAYGVNSIFQDSKGWMWFTTGYEVMRYDGHQFKTWPLAANTVMNFCFRIREVNNEIWIMAAPFILKVSGDSLRRVQLIDDSTQVTDLIQHRGQSFFLGKNGLYEMKADGLRSFITTTSLAANSPHSLTSFSDSLLITYKPGEQLIVFNIKHKLFYSIPLEVTDIRLDERENILLLVKGKGIVHLRQIKVKDSRIDLVADPVILFDEPAYATFTADGQGRYWTFDQFRELVKLGPGTDKRAFNESDGLPSLWFSNLFVDREKNLWICFNSGLSKIRNTNSERYTTSESLYSNHILFFTKGPGQGQVIAGTQNGVNIFENKQVRQVKHRGQPFFCNGFIAASSTIYYYRDSFLYSSKMDTNTFSISSEKLLLKLPGTGIQLIKYPGDRFIIATTHGLYAYGQGQLTRLANDTNYFRKIMLDSKGRLWAGKFAFQLHCYRIVENERRLQLEEIFSLDSISSSMPRLVGIRALGENKEGDILVGTRNNGLFVLTVQNDKLVSTKHFGNENGLPGNTVWDIAVDNNGACWIAMMKGLSRMEKIKEEWRLSNEGIKRQLYQATLLYADDENNIWVGSHPGIVVTRNEPGIQKMPFSVSVTGIMINGKNLTSAQSNTSQKLKHTDDNVTIEFSANTYTQEEVVLYSYRLNDNDEWTTPAVTHRVNYSALRPGQYKFSVKAINADGQWSINEAKFEFGIMAPFWKRGWFIALVIAAVASGVYGLYCYRVKRIRELFEMRNVIASDLHDEIGSTLTSINILSKVSHNHLDNDKQKASSLLKKVIDQSQQIQENMSDIVWSIRPDNDKMENIILRMHEYLNHTLEPANIHVGFIVDDKIVKESLTMQQRRDFFLVFKEAINNIAKYAQCTETDIRLTLDDGKICLLIRDNGIGFDPAASGGSNGLRNMRHRAELLKGKISIRSVRGHGTSVELKLPATQ